MEKFPKKLILFKNYTIDARLKQIRVSNSNRRTLKFIEFDSSEGREILKEYQNSILDEK